MFNRHHKLIARRAALWLLAVLFAMPVSFCASCSCLAECCLSAHGDAACTCDESKHTPCSNECAGSHIIALSPLLSPLCGCGDDCPCECRRSDEVSTIAVVNRQDEQKEFLSINACVETMARNTPRCSSVAVSTLPTDVATSALQCCISLSRFIL